MNKNILTLFLAVALVLILPTLAQAANLRVGSSGPEVRTLQSQLTTAGYSVGPIDGDFGPLTKKGVLNFQSTKGLVPDGIVGPLTQAVLSPPVLALQRQAKTDAILATAKQYLGTPYLWGGTTPAGFDCSGYTQYVFGKNGIGIQRVSRDQANNGNEVTYSGLQPGDLMFFSIPKNGVVTHVGIYLGGGQFIGAENAGVRVVTITQYWVDRYVIARRVY